MRKRCSSPAMPFLPTVLPAPVFIGLMLDQRHLALLQELGAVRRILPVVLVPGPVLRPAVPVGHAAGEQEDISPLRFEKAGHRLVVGPRGLQAADDLAALRAVPAEKIIEAGLALATEMSAAGRGYTGAVDTLVVDGWFMPDTPTNIFAQDKQNNVPILLCANIGELIAEKSFLVAPEMLKGYVKRLESTDRLGTNGYAAIFTQVPSNWKEDGVLANHGLEVPYVFGALDVLKTSVFFEIFERPSGAVQQDPGLTEDDTKVSEAMMTMWVQFAKTGDPSVEGLIDWPTWDPASDKYLDIAWPLEVKSGYSKFVPEE
jgi:para-nitrobenzyl esterase